MTTYVIGGYSDKGFDLVEELFYSNFTADDWDYIIVGEEHHTVENIAKGLRVCDYQIKQIEDKWMAVTYHA